jgi:hypothetical protein
VKLTHAAAVAATATLALPAIGAAHDATVTCDPLTGKHVVTPDYLHRNPVVPFTATTYTVRWDDGYRLTRPLPAPCPAPPPPPVEPPLTPAPPPVATPTPPPPVVVVPPPVQVDTPPRRVTSVRTKITRRSKVVHRARCFTRANPRRSYVVWRTTTTWSRGGKVLRTKVTNRRVFGAVCVVMG